MKSKISNPPDQRRSPGCVLVVDDEEQNRSLLRDPLEARGYEVEEAENGVLALQKIAVRPPDVILLDLMMPNMDGFEVCRRLKKDLKTAHIPILIVTALSDRKERLMGIEAGANDFLNKPIDIQDVILRVGNAVYAKHLHDQLQIEQEKSEQLLLNILPKPIAERMKKGETNIADSHPDVTVLVADLVGFTTLSAHIDPEQIVQLLNEIFSAFDLLAEKHGLEKIKTIRRRLHGGRRHFLSPAGSCRSERRPRAQPAGGNSAAQSGVWHLRPPADWHLHRPGGRGRHWAQKIRLRSLG